MQFVLTYVFRVILSAEGDGEESAAVVVQPFDDVQVVILSVSPL